MSGGGFGHEAIAVMGGQDAPGRGAVEMGAEHKGIRRRRIREEPASTRVMRTSPTFQVIFPKLPPTSAMF